MECLSVPEARCLALVHSGLLAAKAHDLIPRAVGTGRRACAACLRVVRHFGYLQLDSVMVSGARTHSLVLASRIEGLNAAIGETLLQPSQPLFEYWGHETCWLPLELYSAFGFRRRAYRVHPWWGDVLTANQALAGSLLDRIRINGPLRSVDLEGRRGNGWWNAKLAKRVLEALWSAGEIAVRERRSFQRCFDLTERVIPEANLADTLSDEDALDTLLRRALVGHGWATTGTLIRTWRLVGIRTAVNAALQRLRESGAIQPCGVKTDQRIVAGWVQPDSLNALPAWLRLRPRRDRGVALSPFDPLLWDRERTRLLFDFDYVIEIYKPAHQRRYGYYAMPILAGRNLIARMVLKTERGIGRVNLLSCHYEHTQTHGQPLSSDIQAMRHAFKRHADAVGLTASDGYINAIPPRK